MLSPFPFSQLHDWYISNGRKNLPWRDYFYDDASLGYRVWLAETMLQQTQVERVKSYFENILKAFPTIEDLAACSYDDFFPYYKGLGYYSRARNMLTAAAQVRDEFDGVFPRETESLRTLKGVGPYTAEAIRAFAYDEKTLSFDTNLEKIFSRYYHGNKFQKLTKDEKSQILSDFEEYYETKSPQNFDHNMSPLIKGGDETQGSGGIARDINNALMDYGATVSLNNISGIDWDNYPLSSSKFYQTRGELEPIKEKKKSTFPNKQAYVIAVLHENHKVYFSENSDFSPFFVGKNTGNPRSLVQSYFLEKYGLELSVRPAEVKSYNSHEIPYMVCYCQIQSGKHDFTVHEGLKVRGFEEGYVDNLKF